MAPLLSAVQPLLARAGLNLAPTAVLATCAVVLLTTAVLLHSLLRSLLRPSKSLPPIVACAPLVGGFLKFVRGPMPLMQSAFSRYGQVFTVPLFHKRVTFLIGPEVSPHFYKARQRRGAPSLARLRRRCPPLLDCSALLPLCERCCRAWRPARLPPTASLRSAHPHALRRPRTCR